MYIETALLSIDSIDEYLRTSYDPDCDYVDGRVEERNGGEYAHSAFQAEMGAYLSVRNKPRSIRAYIAQCLRIGLSRVRISDLRAAKGSSLEEEVFTQPPFIRIEILSEDDRLNRIQERLDECIEFVVPNIWLVDPVKKQAWTYRSVGLLLVHDGIPRASEAGGVYH